MAYLVGRGSAPDRLARARDRGHPLLRVPAPSARVSAELPDAHGRGPQPRVPARAPEDLLRDPLALAVPLADCEFGSVV